MINNLVGVLKSTDTCQLSMKGVSAILIPWKFTLQDYGLTRETLLKVLESIQFRQTWVSVLANRSTEC